MARLKQGMVAAACATVLAACDGGDGSSPSEPVVAEPLPRDNTPPVAVISEIPQSISFGQPIRLDGSSSYDEDGELTEYIWKLNGEFLGDEPVYPNYVLPFGTHTIGLAVSEGGETSPYAERTISVQLDAEQVITAIPETEHAPTRVRLSATDLADNDFDRHRSQTRYDYSWYVESGVPSVSDSSGLTPFETMIMPGINRIQLFIFGHAFDGHELTIEITLSASMEPDAISIYDDRVVVMNITNFEDKILSFVEDDGYAYTQYLVQYASRALYSQFRDDFDFLMLMPYLNDPNDDPWPHGLSYLSLYHAVRNDIRGIGDEEFDNTASYNSEGRLQGVISFGTYKALWVGPNGLHEIMHRWGNYGIIPNYWDPVHWYVSTVNGMLGGYTEDQFQRAPECDTEKWGEGYRIVGFSAGGRAPYRYAPLEMYIAGWIPLEEVPPIRVAPRTFIPSQETIASSYPEGCTGERIYSIPEWETYDNTRILREQGPRLPTVGESQSEFKTAVILVINDDSPPLASILPQLSDGIREFSTLDSGGDMYHGNFWRATGGRATMEMDRLSQSRRAVPSY